MYYTWFCFFVNILTISIAIIGRLWLNLLAGSYLLFAKEFRFVTWFSRQGSTVQKQKTVSGRTLPSFNKRNIKCTNYL